MRPRVQSKKAYTAERIALRSCRASFRNRSSFVKASISVSRISILRQRRPSRRRFRWRAIRSAPALRGAGRTLKGSLSLVTPGRARTLYGSNSSRAHDPEAKRGYRFAIGQFPRHRPTNRRKGVAELLAFAASFKVPETFDAQLNGETKKDE